MISRRDFLQHAGLGLLAAHLPTLSLARAETPSRLVLVLLRGAVDGLALAPPYGDRDYLRQRGELALPPPGKEGGVLPLDASFGLHPALAGIHAAYRDHQALIVHAVASPYRERSHFDGQDLLEIGAAEANALRDGWLNRALGPMNGVDGAAQAIALSQNTPLVLRGANPVTSWVPSRLPEADESTLARLADLYAGDEFFATRLTQALAAQEVAGAMPGMGSRVRGNDAARLRTMMEAAGRFLRAEEGPRIAVLEAGGWDTHANQGATQGQLANRFAALDTALDALRQALGDTWSNTAVALVTEFGRTVRPNGTGGTDHGTATAAVLMGGAVRGGRVIADWPGLADADLHDGRDLAPTIDIRALFVGLLVEHLPLPTSFVQRSVLPGSAHVAPLHGLTRRTTG